MTLAGYPKEMTLRNKRRVLVRPLESGDFERLHKFFLALPEGDRLFLRHDVSDPNVVRNWVNKIDFDRVIPLLALDGDEIIADGTLHLAQHGWLQHVGGIRMVVAASHRQLGLGSLLARELVALAEQRGLEKLQAQMIEDDLGAIKMFKHLGFKPVALIKDVVKDRQGARRNLAIMMNDVTDLGRIMEDWIQDCMIPEYRSTGEA
jgi:GNAT superfamily N-acetyltransferase